MTEPTVCYWTLGYQTGIRDPFQVEWWSTRDRRSAGACEDSEVLRRDGSIFALGACSSDDGGEEASALWRSHQHGSLVLVDDLNLELERGKGGI